MFWKTDILLILLCMVISSNANKCELDVVKNINKYIKENLNMSQVTLYTTSPQELSQAATYILKELLSNFATDLVKSEKLNNRLNNQKLIQMRNILSLQSKSETFKIMIIDENTDCYNLEKLSIDYINFLISVTYNYSQSKYFIVVMNRKVSCDFIKFFENSWLHSILNIVVIEITKSRNKNIFITKRLNDKDTILHTYNPINKIYMKTNFSSTIPLFSDKSRQLQGISLRAAFHEEFPGIMMKSDYTSKNAIDLLFGYHVSIVKILTETLNFTVKLEIVTVNSSKLMQFNITYSHLKEALKRKLIDFTLNLFTVATSRAGDNLGKVGCYLGR